GLSLSGSFAMHQGCLNGPEGVGAGQNVGDEYAGRGRIPLFGLIAEVGRIVTAGSMDDRCIGRARGARARLSVTGDRTIDELRIVLTQRGVVEAESSHHAGTKILHHDVAKFSKVVNDGLGGVTLEVDRQAF